MHACSAGGHTHLSCSMRRCGAASASRVPILRVLVVQICPATDASRHAGCIHPNLVQQEKVVIAIPALSRAAEGAFLSSSNQPPLFLRDREHEMIHSELRGLRYLVRRVYCAAGG